MESGARIVRYACSMVPVEVVMAAGFSPARIIPVRSGSRADGLIHPNTCCYLRGIFADALAGAFDGAGAVVLANSCDGMRRLFDLWTVYVPGVPALFLDLPRKKDAAAVGIFASGLRELAGRLAGLPGGRAVTAETLREAAGEVNRVRTAFTGLFRAMAEGRGSERGRDVFELLCREEMPDPAEMDAMAASLAGTGGNGRRVLVTGNALSRPVLVEMLEGAGASIAGFDTCFGMRHYALQVDEGAADPFEAVAARYLRRPPCARMTGMDGHVAFLKEAVAGTDADGVVVSRVKFCDGSAYAVPLVREAAEAAGARCLELENDHEWSDAEKARTQVETFVDMLGQGR